MGLKIIADGIYGSGKTAFAVTMVEIGPIGVADTEQRWQFYTVPHPDIKPTAFTSPRGTDLPVYSNPRMLRDDVPWLVKSHHPIYLVEVMDPAMVWACHEAWAQDPNIVGQVTDSGSVIWDLLQAERDEYLATLDPDVANKVGALAWGPVKAKARRMIFSAFGTGQHYIITAHLKEKMAMRNGELVVTGVSPWLEKKTPHWVDLVLQFVYPEGAKQPKMRVDIEKVLGGRDGTELVKGSVIDPAPTFRGVMERAGIIPKVKTFDANDLDKITGGK